MNHILFQTDDANATRVYLASAVVKIPEKVGKGRIRHLTIDMTDPDGHHGRDCALRSRRWTRQNKGKFLLDIRISEHMTHVGVLVGNLEASTRFYHGILGFKEFWRGRPPTSGGNARQHTAPAKPLLRRRVREEQSRKSSPYAGELLTKVGEICDMKFKPASNGQKVIRAAAEALGKSDPTARQRLPPPGLRSTCETERGEKVDLFPLGAIIHSGTGIKGKEFES